MSVVKLKHRVVITLAILLSGCGGNVDNERADNDGSTKESQQPLSIEKPKVTDTGTSDTGIQQPSTIEPVDEAGTQALNNKLLGSLEGISRAQTEAEESASKDTLEQLSEADRRALIEMTIESSAQKVSEDAEQVLETLTPE